MVPRAFISARLKESIFETGSFCFLGPSKEFIMEQEITYKIKEMAGRIRELRVFGPDC